MLTAHTCLQGEQVFISYGPQGNDSLLQFYGFVEAGNPHRRVPRAAVGGARARRRRRPGLGTGYQRPTMM